MSVLRDQWIHLFSRTTHCEVDGTHYFVYKSPICPTENTEDHLFRILIANFFFFCIGESIAWDKQFSRLYIFLNCIKFCGREQNIDYIWSHIWSIYELKYGSIYGIVCGHVYRLRYGAIYGFIYESYINLYLISYMDSYMKFFTHLQNYIWTYM